MSAIQDLLLSCKIGAPIEHGSLRVYPLVAERPGVIDCLLLDEALDGGGFLITEISEAGSVPQLLAVNELGTPVFLLDGEELVGAKQNRILNLSFVVPPRSRTQIPVSCVEAGRWQRQSANFQSADRAQFARGRASKLSSVSASLAERGEAASDQMEVWDAISEKAERLSVHSPTSAMSAIFEGRRETIDDCLAHMPTLPNQVGAVYVVAGTIAGMDVFASPKFWEKLAPKIHASYILDALEIEQACTGQPDVESFMARVSASSAERYSGSGMGDALRFSNGNITGAALELQGECIHLSAFERVAA